MSESHEKCPWCGTEISRAKFEQITTKIRAEEKQKLSETEAAIQKRYQEQFEVKLNRERELAVQKEKKESQSVIKELKESLAKAMSEQQSAKKAVQEASAREAKLKKEIAAQAEREKKLELSEQRRLLEDEHDKEMAKLHGEKSREREKLQKQVDLLKRQLEKQTANDLGDGAEINLYESLRDYFRDDRVSRVRKGEAGADIHIEVLHKGEACGLIIVDSKNRQSWQRSFALKLHEDQVNAKADHAVLATRVFPGGRKELCIEDGVIVVNPLRAIHVITMLRDAIVKMHILGLTMKERDGKTEDLYRWITSDEYTQKFAEADRLTKDILDLDVQEQKEHQNVWKRRGKMAVRLQKMLREIDAETVAILEGSLATADTNGQLV